MSDGDTLGHFVTVWRACADDVIGLLRSLPDDAWSRPTDLPGWDVHAVAAHLAHVESELAGAPQPEAEPGYADAPHVRGPMGEYVERGVVARRRRTPVELVDELERSVDARAAALSAEPPADGSAPGPGFAALAGWSWATLLSKRPFDLWMHEQDIRRATERPGNLDSAGAEHALDVLSGSLGYVLSRRAEAEPGSSMVVDVLDAPRGAATFAVEIADDGRGRALPSPPASPTVHLVLGFEEFVMLSGGRRAADRVKVDARGDADLAQRIIARMAVTP